MFAPNLNLLADLWGKKSEEEIKLNRQNEEQNFVNAIDVAQNVKQSGPLSFICSF